MAAGKEPIAAGGIDSDIGSRGPTGSTLADARRVGLDVASMANLGDSQQQIIRLAYFGGHTQRQIARVTGVSVEEVRATMLAAMRKLADARRFRGFAA